MILIHGELRPDSEQKQIIESLPDKLYATLEKGNVLKKEKVIAACDRLAKRVLGGEFDEIVLPLLKSFDISYDRFCGMAAMFEKEGLEKKCAVELPPEEVVCGSLISRRYPLGVLMHIAAGNIDGLPAYSVVEGLLAGNINLLKLPAGDSGMSVKLLSELISEEPILAEYIYVFDVPSTETETLKQIADLSDAVVVWGGDAAVRAARTLADVTTKIISWGHKLSFAYAVPGVSDEELEGLAAHICETEQVLCSSCQGIFLDSDSEEEQLAFAERFFDVLKRVSAERSPADFGMRAKNAICLYNEKLESAVTGNRIFSGGGVSVICSRDGDLCLSYMFRSVWVKNLPRREIVRRLKSHKDHLQTVGLLCSAEERETLSAVFASAGVTKITTGKEMSAMNAGEAHDGIYPLRAYSRIVDICF